MVARRFAPKYTASIDALVRDVGFTISHSPIPPRAAGAGDADTRETPSRFVAVPPELLAAPKTRKEANAAHAKALAGTPPMERRAMLIQRQAHNKLADVARKGICVYCWLPEAVCFCRTIAEAFTAGTEPGMPHPLDELAFACRDDAGNTFGPSGIRMSDVSGLFRTLKRLSEVAEIVVILHSDELLRQSNTGHILGLMLDAPVLLWGYPPHEAIIVSWGVANERMGISSSAANCHPISNNPEETTTYLLYPSENSINVDDVRFEEACTRFMHQAPHLVDDAQAQCTTAITAAGSPKPALRIALSDGTWGEAGSVNRHVMASIPRLHVAVPEDYVSLFAPLRTQTRKSGVSTMEATAMAVTAMLRRPAIASLMPAPSAAAEEVGSAMCECMMRYVDVQCVQKGLRAVHFPDMHHAVAARLREGQSHVHARVVGCKTSVIVDEAELRRLMWSPLLYYCFPCRRFVGWSRMPEHVLGTSHRDCVNGRSLAEAWSAPPRAEQERFSLE